MICWRGTRICRLCAINVGGDWLLEDIEPVEFVYGCPDLLECFAEGVIGSGLAGM